MADSMDWCGPVEAWGLPRRNQVSGIVMASTTDNTP